MAIEDIKGYQPHTADKVETVNKIKDAENILGTLYSNLLSSIHEEMQEVRRKALINCEDKDAEHDAFTKLNELGIRYEQVKVAIQKLKESSMWACRAVFRPDEKY